MNTVLGVFLVALLLAFGLTPMVRWLAPRIGGEDQPHRRRKIHLEAIPRLGGVTIFVAFFGALIASRLAGSVLGRYLWADPKLVLGVMAGGGIVFAVGLMDDLKGVRPAAKLAAQVTGGCIAYWAGFRIVGLNTPWGFLAFGLLALPVTVFWITSLSNALNLMDGMDGLATGITLVASITMLVLSIRSLHFVTAMHMAALAGACLGFLAFNSHPATIFLGDSGSLLLGYLLGTVVLYGSFRHKEVGLLIPIIVFGLPIMDTLLAMVRRWARRAPISRADKQHIHHRLLIMGFSHRQAVGLLYGLATLLGVAAIALSVCRTVLQVIILVLLVGVFYSVIRFLKWGDWRGVQGRIRRDLHRRRQMSGNWSLINDLAEEIRLSEESGRLQYLLEKVFEGLDVDRASLLTNAGTREGDPVPLSVDWSRGGSPTGQGIANAWSANLEIRHEKILRGRLFLLKDVDRSELAPDIAACVAVVVAALAERLARDEAAPVTGAVGRCPPRHRILIVDDEQSVRSVLSLALRAEDRVIETARDGQEALQLFSQQGFHLVFMDMVMPRMDGLEAAKAILTRSPSSRIVVMSGQYMPGKIQAALEAGAICFLQKPFDLAGVRTLTEEVLNAG